MNADWKTQIARRPLLAGLLGAAGLGIAAGLVYVSPRWTRRRYPRTPYDDLLSQLSDRDNAAKLGAAVIAEQPQFDAKATAQALRARIGNGLFRRSLAGDLAQGHLVEIDGWVLPQSLAMMAGIAAKVPSATF